MNGYRALTLSDERMTEKKNRSEVLLYPFPRLKHCMYDNSFVFR